MTNDARVFSNNPKKNQAIFIKEHGQGRNYSIFFFGRGVLCQNLELIFYNHRRKKGVVLPV